MKIFSNEKALWTVCMGEDAHLVAGELILAKAREAAGVEDEAVENLVREHARLVYRVAYAVLRSHPDAEDVVQETFLRVLKHSHKLAGIENPKTWLARIAWRLAVDRSKSGKRKQEVGIADSDPGFDRLAGPESAADEVLDRARVGEALQRFIAALPKKLREPLVLSTIEEMSPREAGAVLGINEAAVRSRIFRARQILKEKLAAEFGGGEEKRHAGSQFRPRS